MRSISMLRAVFCSLLVTCGLWHLADAARADGPRDHAVFNAIRAGDAAVLESHLREGAPANAQAADGTTPLMLASLHGTPEMVRLLLDYGADPNLADKRRATPLLFAVGDARKVELLIARGANVNARSSTGNTPLVAAAGYSDNLPVVKLLLDHGADLHAKNNNGVSGLAAAVYANDAQSVTFFLERGCKPEQIKNLFGAVENSLLAVAAQMADAEIVDLLLKQNVEVNAPDANFAGHALNYALLAQNAAAAKRLIEAGADVKLCTSVGQTPPLLLATYFETGDASVIRMLVKRGADVTAANQSGESPLTWARRRGYPEMIAALKKAGAPERDDPRPQLPKREVPKTTAERDAMLQAAIEKSVALMQRTSDVFLENRRTCVSCHHQNLQAVALGWARDRGVAIDDAAVDRIVERNLKTWAFRTPAAYEMDRPMPAPPQLLGYGLWGLSALGHSADEVTDAYSWYLAAIQKPDGHWIPGAITRPPMGGSRIMSTVLAMRALQLYPPPGRREETRARVAKTRHWLSNCQPATHQDLVYKLLGLAWAGAPAHELQGDLTRLVEMQQADGGWAQLPQLSSDAWATGQSLLALRIAGRVPLDDDSFRRGSDYLLSTQFDDGSWYVQSRAWPFQPPFESGFPFGRDQWISAGATAFATMALLLELEPSDSARVPSRAEPRPAAVAVKAPATAPAKPAAAPATVPAPAREQPVDFARDIKPVLERSCAGCHSGETPEGAFRVTDRAALLRGGESGDAAVLPGQSGESPLWARVSSNDELLAMPPLAKRDTIPALSAAELGVLRDWIDAGAAWPEGATVEVKE
ncbi:MAG: ankyrin repeat domain-containing protein [Pirellulales bacterium]